MLKKLRELWDVKDVISDAWAELAIQTGLDEAIDPIETVGDALEQITVADLLERFPAGFAVGPMAGLYEITGTGPYNEITNRGTLVIKKVFKRLRRSYGEEDDKPKSLAYPQRR